MTFMLLLLVCSVHQLTVALSETIREITVFYKNVLWIFTIGYVNRVYMPADAWAKRSVMSTVYRMHRTGK